MEKLPRAHESNERFLYPDIAEELIRRAEEDQNMRETVDKGGDWDLSIDERNTEYIKGVIAKIGYPTIPKVGRQASHMAWLIIQHAVHDPEFQVNCLTMLKNQEQGEIQPSEIAYLEDRVRVRRDTPQLYGTQFYTNEDGVYDAYPIEDLEHVEERRLAFNMGSFEEYRKEILQLNQQFIQANKHKYSQEEI